MQGRWILGGYLVEVAGGKLASRPCDTERSGVVCGPALSLAATRLRNRRIGAAKRFELHVPRLPAGSHPRTKLVHSSHVHADLARQLQL